MTHLAACVVGRWAGRWASRWLPALPGLPAWPCDGFSYWPMKYNAPPRNLARLMARVVNYPPGGAAVRRHFEGSSHREHRGQCTGTGLGLGPGAASGANPSTLSAILRCQPCAIKVNI